MSASTSVEAASVGELLDQAEDLLYALATGTPSGHSLLAAWPKYAAACARLTSAAVGPRLTGHTAVARHPDTDPVLVAGLRLHATIGATHLATKRADPDPILTRAAQVIGAASDLIECAHDRPGVGQRDAAQADTSRTAGIIRAAELTLTGLDLTIRACGRTQQDEAPALANSSTRLTFRAAPLFITRRCATDVMDAGAGRPIRSSLDDVRVPTVGSVGSSDDRLDRLHLALADWRMASLQSVQRPAVSSAELQRTTIEARQVIALAAALTDAGRAAGLLPAATATIMMAQLQRAGAGWSAATNVWTRFTTGVQPGQSHIRASLELQAAVRALTRGEGGAWLRPDELHQRLDVLATLEAARRGIGDVVDVGRAHRDTVSSLGMTGGVYAQANALPLEETRVAARLRGQYVRVSPGEGSVLGDMYREAAHRTATAYRQVTAVTAPAPVPSPKSRLHVRARQQAPPPRVHL